MKIGPKFKIARRLGAPIFPKTQTQKFKANQEKKGGGRSTGRPRAKSEYGRELNEKQKARFTYGITEKQFSNYANKVISRRNQAGGPEARLFEELERRLDNVVFRLGLAKSRMAARQMVSHGHITVNGRKLTIPSYQVSKGEQIGVREGSVSKALFQNLSEEGPEAEVPPWLNLDWSKKAATVEAMPTLSGDKLLFDLAVVLEFYKR